MLSAWKTVTTRASTVMDFVPGSKAICIDTGASSSISNDRKDFITFHPVTDQVISGISSGLKVKGGTLCWIIRDDNGDDVILHISDALYVPKVPLCLLCPQQVAKQTGNLSDGFIAGGINGIFIYDGFTCTIPYHGRNGLPLLFSADPGTIHPSLAPSASISSINAHAKALLSTEVPTSPTTNLTRVQCKLLHIHECMAHLRFDEVQQLVWDGHFGDNLHCISACDKPLTAYLGRSFWQQPTLH
jgi:hypothetical protein